MKTYIQEWRDNFRSLEPGELQIEIEAMRWLYKLGFTIETIQSLNIFQIKNNCLTKVYATRHFVFRRIIPLAGSPLEKQLNQLPNLKSRIKVFPKLVWTKRASQGLLVPSWKIAEIRNFLGLKPKKTKGRYILAEKKEKLIFNIYF